MTNVDDVVSAAEEAMKSVLATRSTDDGLASFVNYLEGIYMG